MCVGLSHFSLYNDTAGALAGGLCRGSLCKLRRSWMHCEVACGFANQGKGSASTESATSSAMGTCGPITRLTNTIFEFPVAVFVVHPARPGFEVFEILQHFKFALGNECEVPAIIVTFGVLEWAFYTAY